jgi:hypothetical protein
MPDEICDLLNRIKCLEELWEQKQTYTHLPIHKNIWRGSYDVWSCEQDRIDATEIPKARMKEAAELGYIESRIIKHGNYDYEVWALTESGKVLNKTGGNHG